jgi:hypothetical protein
MRSRAVILAVAIVMAPLGARGADLVVWWEEGFYAEEARGGRGDRRRRLRAGSDVLGTGVAFCGEEPGGVYGSFFFVFFSQIFRYNSYVTELL